MKFLKIIPLFCFALGAQLSASDAQIQNQLHNQPQQLFSQKDIFNALFDLYLPETAHLTNLELKQRAAWKEILWKEMEKNEHVLLLINALQPHSPLLPDDVKSAFADLVQCGIQNASPDRIKQLQYALRHHQQLGVRKFAAQIRLFFAYYIYNSPFTEKLIGFSISEKKVFEGKNIEFPESLLYIEDSEIKHKNGIIDYVIVGSGPAGSVIASELSKKGYMVVLLESGSFVKPGTKDTEFCAEFMESNNTRTTDTGGITLRNGHAVGGGTIPNINLAFSPLLPSIKTKIEHWISSGTLPSEYVHEHGQDWKKLKTAYEWVMSSIGTRSVGLHEVNRNNRILLDGISTGSLYNLNTKDPESCSDCPAKISAVDAFLLPALCNHNLSIIPNARVKKILFSTKNDHQSYATGVEFTFSHPIQESYIISDINNFGAVAGGSMKIQANAVILCAGTLATPEILLRSNVNNKQIGKGIVVHPSIGIYGRFTEKIDATEGLSASVYAPSETLEDGYFFESMSADPTFMALMHPGSGNQIVELMRDIKYIAGFGIMLVDSVDDGNMVYIDSRTGALEVHYVITDNDRVRLKKAIKRAAELLFDAGAYEVYIPSYEKISANEHEYVPLTAKEHIDHSVENLQFIENENLISSAHMQGSCKLGAFPDTSVVSRNFKLWNTDLQQEYENIYVCDTSIFPTSIGANPMQAVYTFAKIFADTIPDKRYQ